MELPALRATVRDGSLTAGIYAALRRVRDHRVAVRRLRGKYEFDDRRHHAGEMCLVLAGYKEFLWDAVFERISAHLPEGVDVCVVSPGVRDAQLESVCSAEGWSYLSTEDNIVTLAQNIAIHLHPAAQRIIKLDEDVFITANFFPALRAAYDRVIADGRYDPLFVAPLIPVNGYGHVRVLEKLGLEGAYEERFGSLRYASRNDRLIQSSPSLARFLWSDGGLVPTIDELDARFGAEPADYRPCAIRFSIGAILLPRSTWSDMGMFEVQSGSSNLGVDESQLCQWGIAESRAIIVAENTVVGHLSFGPQNEEMGRYFLEHRHLF